MNHEIQQKIKAEFYSEKSSTLLTPSDLASYLGIGRNLAYKLLSSGEIKGFRIGNQWKVSREAVDEYILRKCK